MFSLLKNRCMLQMFWLHSCCFLTDWRLLVKSSLEMATAMVERTQANLNELAMAMVLPSSWSGRLGSEGLVAREHVRVALTRVVHRTVA